MTTPLDIEKLRAYAIPQARDNYDPRDVILYALGVGAGLSDEVDDTAFLYERQIHQATVRCIHCRMTCLDHLL